MNGEPTVEGGIADSQVQRVPLSQNDGRRFPLFLTVASDPEGNPVLRIEGPLDYRNMVGEEKYARHLLSFVNDPVAQRQGRRILDELASREAPSRLARLGAALRSVVRI